MPARPKVLIVDDDAHIRDVVSFALEKAEMEVMEAGDGRQAVDLHQSHRPDLIVLDINMPEMDGLEVCTRIRKTSEVPILFLSSRDDEIDRVLGLEIGGDDYMTKPFSPRELLARVKVILKRVRPPVVEEPAAKVLGHGHIQLDRDAHQVTWNGQPVDLTAVPFAILEAMLAAPGKVFDRNAIMDRAYRAQTYVSDRTIDSHIRQIRKKFSDLGCQSVIETVHGVGYRLGSCK